LVSSPFVEFVLGVHVLWNLLSLLWMKCGFIIRDRVRDW